MSAAPVVATTGLTKSYGQSRGIVDVTMTIEAGEVFAFLGPNGAGKTTTVRTLLDFIRPTSGRATVLGIDPHDDSVEVHRRVGYLPGEFALYEHMTGRDYLGFLAALRGGVAERQIDSLAERLQSDLDGQDRVALARQQAEARTDPGVHASAASPDPGRADARTRSDHAAECSTRLILEAREAGQSVFLSSHVLPEVERMCDRVGIIREGRLITVEDVGALKARAVRVVDLHFAHPVPAEAFAEPARRSTTSRCTATSSVAR